MILVLDDLQWANDETLSLLEELGTSLADSPAGDRRLLPPRDAGPLARLGLRQGRQRPGRSPQPRARSRREHAPQPALALRSHPGGSGRGRGRDDRRQSALSRAIGRLFIANGTIDSSQETWRLDPDRAADTELPISIEEAIEARIAALEPDERDLLEKGAVFGNVFWVSAIVALTRIESVRPTRRSAGGPPPIPPRARQLDQNPHLDPRRRSQSPAHQRK